MHKMEPANRKALDMRNARYCRVRADIIRFTLKIGIFRIGDSACPDISAVSGLQNLRVPGALELQSRNTDKYGRGRYG